MTGQEYINNQELHPFCLIGRDPLIEDVADAFEQGKADGYNELLSKAWDETTIKQWFIDSVDGNEPKWTDAHIEELCKDFILIKKEE